jgi:hypothetical protein
MGGVLATECFCAEVSRGADCVEPELLEKVGGGGGKAAYMWARNGAKTFGARGRPNQVAFTYGKLQRRWQDGGRSLGQVSSPACIDIE